MLVVSNTSPISNLALIGRLDLLHTQFGGVCIPPAVNVELTDLPDAHARAAVQAAIQASWLKDRQIADLDLVAALTAGLHQGESEAIALAVQLRADLVLIDEREARTTAIRLNLRVTGVLGVLLRARRDGAIGSLRHEVDALRAKARFFIASHLEQQILREAGE